MKLRGILVLLALSFAGAAAQAQIGLYGKLDLSHYSENANKTTTWFYGPGFGVYDDFFHFGPLRVGADVRGDFLYGSNNQRFRSILGGARVEVKPPLLGIKPYVEGLVGGGGTVATGGLNAGHYSGKFEYQVLGGVDSTILPRIDFRMVEVGYGQIKGVNGTGNAPNTDVLTISTGIVFRLPIP